MYDFIKNPSKSIDENAYAKQLDKKWENVIMTSFPYLSDPGIDSIMNFIENYIAPITTIKVAVD